MHPKFNANQRYTELSDFELSSFTVHRLSMLLAIENSNNRELIAGARWVIFSRCSSIHSKCFIPYIVIAFICNFSFSDTLVPAVSTLYKESKICVVVRKIVFDASAQSGQRLCYSLS